MKDEFNGNKIDEFVGLKSKMYSLISNNIEMNKAKGISLKLKQKEYISVLFGKKIRAFITFFFYETTMKTLFKQANTNFNSRKLIKITFTSVVLKEKVLIIFTKFII